MLRMNMLYLDIDVGGCSGLPQVLCWWHKQKQIASSSALPQDLLISLNPRTFHLVQSLFLTLCTLDRIFPDGWKYHDGLQKRWLDHLGGAAKESVRVLRQHGNGVVRAKIGHFQCSFDVVCRGIGRHIHPQRGCHVYIQHPPRNLLSRKEEQTSLTRGEQALQMPVTKLSTICLNHPFSGNNIRECSLG